MIISPPLLRNKSDTESDAAWIERMIPVDTRRGFPVNAWHTWHGGVHLIHSDSTSRPEKIRAIADGTVHFVRQPKFSQRDQPPYNYNGGTDCGCVVLKHETEIGNGENGKVTFFSLYMHLKTIDSTVSQGKTVYRKDPLGTVGQVDGANAVHFQIFCDDANLLKLVGRTERELNIIKDGRTDVVYGDMHFYLPAGIAFCEKVPEKNRMTTWGKAPYTSLEPLFITMSFDKGKCTMTTRRQHQNGHYETVGEALVSEDYEYNLYKKAVELYPDSPSAGYEMLRFGRIINTEHEILSPADAPHWREVNYPGGKGWVNLAVSEVKKFSDADFPHWMEWQLIDDDSDSNSQCNSPTLLAQLNAETEPQADLSYAICHFPFEWDGATVESRFNWLKLPNDALDEPMSEEDWDKFIAHVKALCIDMAGLPSGRVWHFEPRRFITHFRKCGWLDISEFKQLVPRYAIRKINATQHTWEAVVRDLNSPDSIFSQHRMPLNRMMRKYGINTPMRMACFLGNSLQETGWLSALSENGGTGLWYAPWYGRGFLQLTNPDNYISYWKFRGRDVSEDLRNSLVNAYRRISRLTGRQRSNISLQDIHFPALTQEMIGWRNQVGGSDNNVFAPSDSAGYYWIISSMAKYADQPHVLERYQVSTNQGNKVYYRSPSFWEASAAVNLPRRVGELYHRSLNGFDSRCCAYGYAIAVLSEMKFPNSRNESVLDFPEGYRFRRS
ncbi:peptidoglycan DD-metalloendopeptidase family protein [Photorhabdus bodei]|uniref:Peptidoglycan DD-metalloendopeptidase family protein n=1 Tax=Photorhabdus bodei TaxID=2029681 RepID=A0AAW6BRH8_9GAMM|nr:peptidoglycan DD-metalloendopeptidase family protein [Photorhabdus bodei]MDB6374262.1 peptidoglycan DD-metalloendopeptidase family protein [Photorhabdus bodei]